MNQKLTSISESEGKHFNRLDSHDVAADRFLDLLARLIARTSVSEATVSTRKQSPRAKDQAKYPLVCRVRDMTNGCRSVMYGRTSGKRALYTCGRYMRTASSECANNQVDAEALHRLVLSGLRQFAALGMRRAQLVDLLQVRVAESAAVNTENVSADDELARLRRVRHQLSESRNTVGRRLANEPDDDLCTIIRSEFDRLTAELHSVDQDIDRLKQKSQRPGDPEAEVNGALCILEQLDQVIKKPEARFAFRDLAARLGIRIGLTFASAIKGKVRRVQRLVGGQIAFGDREMPEPLHGRDRLNPSGEEFPPTQPGHDNCEHAGAKDKSSREGTLGADPSGSAPSAMNQNESHREGVSSTKVSRGDRRCTFPNDLSGIRLLHAAISQSRPFSAAELVILSSGRPS